MKVKRALLTVLVMVTHPIVTARAAWVAYLEALKHPGNREAIDHGLGQFYYRAFGSKTRRD